METRPNTISSVVVMKGYDRYEIVYREWNQELYRKDHAGYDHDENSPTYGQAQYKYERVDGQWMCLKNDILVDTFQNKHGCVHLLMRINSGKYDDL